MQAIKHILFFWLAVLPLFVFSQSSTLRGVVLDQQSETPLIGVTIQSIGIEPIIGAITDIDGSFVIKNAPVGRLVLRVTYLGYEQQTIPNILVTAGKEVQLNLRMQESFTIIGEVVITAKTDKDRPMNELATISARQFNTEEVSRYSGGRNDVAKLVANFAGVAANNDSRNDIIIRGNSPTGVLWRIEGIPVPNPNHFSTLGTTGGPVSALNPNLIGNSDFLTGAFPAEYGNALAGVFDINFRTGNKERFEFTGQLGAFTGVEAIVEGPFNPKKDGSFIVAFRNSFVAVAQVAGLNVGTTAIPNYRDLSFNVDFGKSKAGRFSLFGIMAQSDIDFIAADLDSIDLWAERNENAYSNSRFSVVGLRHNILVNAHSYIRTVLSGSFTGVKYTEEFTNLQDGNDFLQKTEVKDDLVALRLSSFYNNKINARLSLRTGIMLQGQNLNTLVRSRDNIPDFDGDGLPDWYTSRDFDGNFLLTEAYVQTQYRITSKLTLNTGIHSQYFDKTEDFAVEPRVAINMQVSRNSKINLGYGLHHQTQPLPVFLFQERQPNGTVSAPTNDNLGFTRNQHIVLGYDFKPLPNWRFKAEAYYQFLSEVPVDGYTSSFSMLNTGADFIFPEKGSLKNDGTGYNRGLELTAEKFFSKGYYGMVTVSLYESKYKGSDEITRSTAFDGRYVFNALAGKEFKVGSTGRRFITLDSKFTAAGGRPYTPVNLAASQLAGKEVLYEGRAFSERLDNYFRWDVKMGFRINSAKRKFSQTFFLDLQNVTNHENLFAMRYNVDRGQVGRINQIGFFPDMMYRVEF